MSIVRAQVVLSRRSLLPRDAISNTYHFDAGTNATSTDYSSIAAALVALYQGLAGDNILAQSLSTAALVHKVKVTNLGEFPGGPVSPAGPADQEVTFTTPTTGGTSFPAEVACCVTFEANSQQFSEHVGTTRPASRHRGRVFLGPISANQAFSGSITNDPLVADGTIAAILARFQTMQSTLAGQSPAIAHAVLSKQGGYISRVASYSMDNAFDTIRSRGQRASARTRVTAVAVTLGA